MEPRTGDDCDDKLSMVIDTDPPTSLTNNVSKRHEETPLNDDAVKRRDEMSASPVKNGVDDEDKNHPPVNLLSDPLSHDPDKPLRQVRSHPSLGGRTIIPPGSLGSLSMTRDQCYKISLRCISLCYQLERLTVTNCPILRICD